MERKEKKYNDQVKPIKRMKRQRVKGKVKVNSDKAREVREVRGCLPIFNLMLLRPLFPLPLCLIPPPISAQHLHKLLSHCTAEAWRRYFFC